MANNQLRLVKDQAQQQQKQLSERLEKAVAFVNGERQQLLQLQEYQQDYLDKITGQQQHWNAQHSARYRQFCHQLSLAIQGQQTKLQAAEEQLEGLRQSLYQQQQRIQVLDDMIDRQQQDLDQLQNLALQKELDDHNTRRHFYQ